MTSGVKSGTNGAGGWSPGPWTTVALIGALVAVVTSTSVMMELQRGGSRTHWIEPVLWESTSFASIVALAPLIGWAVQRWPPRPDRLPIFALTHLGLTIPFSLAHVLFIWLTREAAYWAAGARYGFFDDGVAMTILYEWRKDILSYASIAAVYAWFQHRAEAATAARPNDTRIELRDGASAVFLSPVDVLSVEAAGNYVEFSTSARKHMVRGTLAAWEARLAALGFVRVHRSRLVNRGRVSAIRPTASGDVEITLDDGRVVAGSRRYRDALEARVS